MRRRRRVPNTISKRLRRKLRRSRNPYLLWLRLRKPVVYARLARWWQWKFIDTITSISPIDTPLFSLAPRMGTDSLLSTWRTDSL